MENNRSFAEECLAEARVAMNHKKFKEAKEIMMPAFEKEPRNTEVLKMLGGLCVLLGQFREALDYYSKNLELDPDNGDSYYLIGNAYFTNAKYQNAFDSYIMAEEMGCSENVLPKLYYQMGLICSMKGDRKAALIHFQQYEDTDPTGMVALDETFLSEKMKLYLQERDSAEAIRCAKTLLNVKPDNYSYYGLLFNLLMVEKNYAEAEKVLDKAQKYLKLTYEQRIDLAVQRAALYIDIADTDDEKVRVENLTKAKTVIKAAQSDPEITPVNSRELELLTAEIYLKGGYYSHATRIAEKLIEEKKMREVPEPKSVEAHMQDVMNDTRFWSKLTPALIRDEEYRQQMRKLQSDPTKMAAAMQGRRIEERISNADSVSGNKSTVDQVREMIGKMAEKGEEFTIMSEEDFADRLDNVLISCYVDADNYEMAGKYAALLKNSPNSRYANFGFYVSALSAQKLAEQGKCDKETAEELYDQAIARYKKRMLEDVTDSTAAVFRARLYAENGKYVLAEQIAKMMDDKVMNSLNSYIASCRKAAKAED